VGTTVVFLRSILFEYYTERKISMAKKGARVIITLECTEAKKEGKPASRYTSMKNKQNTPQRIELKKYNPFLRRHTVHKEVR
jgi:large subunit ribosomal protein L33